jgi:hypothetical protein
MLSKIGSRPKPDPLILQVASPEDSASGAAEDETDLRRSMYERIARGYALAEVEEHAHQKWRGK